MGASDTGGGGCIDRGLIEYLSNPDGQGKNGIVINGVVAWIDIVQDGPAEMIWKTQADSHYVESSYYYKQTG